LGKGSRELVRVIGVAGECVRAAEVAREEVEYVVMDKAEARLQGVFSVEVGNRISVFLTMDGGLARAE